MVAMGGLGAAWEAQKAQLQADAIASGQLRFCELPITDRWMARLWQQLRLPLPADFVTGPIDLFYSPDFVLPPLRRATRAVLTVHDLTFLRHPETFPPKLHAYLKRAVPRSIRRADHVLADSEATREDLIALLDVPPAKITPLYCGVTARFTSEAAPGERERLQRRYQIDDAPYILAVGTIQPRKNYRRLMEACDPIAAEHNLSLVLAGQTGWMAEPIAAAAAKRPYVHLMGYFEDEDLPALYRQAAVLAFPSLYEGFGLPPLEAMACGTPVVASNASSVPEVVGDAALSVDPLDVEGLTAALRRALDDADLRTQLREAGLAQAATFTWPDAARAWLDLIDQLDATEKGERG
jgi:glycosyltransferase involved in cell wall biosynthesis